MKKILSIIAVICFLSIAGCMNTQQSMSSIVSSVAGLNRVITLYADNGSVIQKWEGRYQVFVDGGAARFMDNGKAIWISGTYTIIEK
jgi:uncharacterized lipoprotein YehR (DUF1307 family)